MMTNDIIGQESSVSANDQMLDSSNDVEMGDTVRYIDDNDMDLNLDGVRPHLSRRPRDCMGCLTGKREGVPTMSRKRTVPCQERKQQTTPTTCVEMMQSRLSNLMEIIHLKEVVAHV